MNIKVKDIVLTDDEIKVLFSISELQGTELSKYAIQDYVRNRIVEEISEAWLRNNLADIVGKIDANKVLNQVLLLISKQAIGNNR